MSEPYLILHKVRGQPAFDVAIQIDLEPVSSEKMWIIPTSGHRAYPSWHIELSKLGWKENTNPNDDWQFEWRCLPDGEINLQMLVNPFPDHYACNTVTKPKPAPRITSTTDDFLV